MFFVLDALWELWLPPHIVTARTSAILNYSIEEYFLSALVFTGTGRAYSLCFLSSSFVMVRAFVMFRFVIFPFCDVHIRFGFECTGLPQRRSMETGANHAWKKNHVFASLSWTSPENNAGLQAISCGERIRFQPLSYSTEMTGWEPSLPPGFLITSKRRFLRP